MKNPIVIGSSGLTDNMKNIISLHEKGAGAIVLKSLFEEEITREMKNTLSNMTGPGNIFPETTRYFEENATVNEGTDNYIKLLEDTKKAVKIPVIASINCITPNQWTFFPSRLQESGADALELNIFSLPSDLQKSASENEQNYLDIIHEVKKSIDIPISVKISFYSGNLGNFIKKLSETGINGIVLFNRFYNIDFDIDNLQVTSTNILSNPEEISTSLRWVAIMANRIEQDIAASTGIHDATGIIKQLLAGAKVVQMVTAFYQHGPEFIQELLEGIETWMIGNGYNNLEDFRGLMGQDASQNPAVYERVQFMKHFRGYKHE